MSASLHIRFEPRFSFEAEEAYCHQMLRDIRESGERVGRALQGATRNSLLQSLDATRACDVCRQPPGVLRPAVVVSNAKMGLYHGVACGRCLADAWDEVRAWLESFLAQGEAEFSLADDELDDDGSDDDISFEEFCRTVRAHVSGEPE